MSRRFGRNQRRRAREALQAAQQEIATTQEHREAIMRTSLQQARKIMAMEAVIDGVRDALGENSIVLQPLTRKMSNFSLKEVALASAMRISCDDTPSSIDAQTLSFRTETAYVLEASISEDSWSRMIHFNLDIGDNRGELRYALDQRLLHEDRARRLVVEQVTHFMAKAFERLLAEGGIK